MPDSEELLTDPDFFRLSAVTLSTSYVGLNFNALPDWSVNGRLNSITTMAELNTAYVGLPAQPRLGMGEQV